MAEPRQKLRMGTRGSWLALAQSRLVADELMRLHAGLHIELITIKTTGDRITDRPLYDVGGKGLFIKELEQALLRKEIDFAVHSLKDVPITMPLIDESDLVMAAIPRREDPRDALVSRSAQSIGDLPSRAKVGTGSLRRRCQLFDARPDLNIELLRGNIDTRVKRLRAGDFDAIILALAGLRRANLFDESIMTPIDVDQLLPAPGQGALSLQCRLDDHETGQLLGVMNDAATAACVQIERKVVEILDGDCQSPIAALATTENGEFCLRVAVGLEGGHPPVRWAVVKSLAGAEGDLASKACSALALRNV